MKKRIISALLVLVFVLALAPTAFADDDPVYVAFIGNEGYETLEAAFSEAQANDTIVIEAGTHNVTQDNKMSVDKAGITIQGAGMDNTIIDCGSYAVSSQAGVLIRADSVTIKDLTIISTHSNGNVSTLKVSNIGNQSTLVDVEDTTINNVKLSSTNGHALNLHGVSNATVDNVNISGYGKCGISLANATNVVVTNTTIPSGGWSSAIGMMYADTHQYATPVSLTLGAGNDISGTIYSGRPGTTESGTDSITLTALPKGYWTLAGNFRITANGVTIPTKNIVAEAKIEDNYYATLALAVAASEGGFTEGWHFTTSPAAENVATGYVVVPSSEEGYAFTVAEKAQDAPEVVAGVTAPAVGGGVDENAEEVKALLNALDNTVTPDEITALATQTAQNTDTSNFVTVYAQKIEELNAGGEDTITFVVQPFLDITITEFDISDNSSAILTLDIKAMYNLIATTVNLEESESIITDNSEGNANAVVLGAPQSLTVNTPVTITIPLTKDLYDALNALESILIRHEKDNGVVYFYEADLSTEGEEYFLTFTSTHGFSTFSVLAGNTTYNVAFDSNDGSTVEPIEDVTPGETISAPPAPERTGYTFDGWYKESSLTNAWNFETDTVTGNITLYAMWTSTSNTSVASTPTVYVRPASVDAVKNESVRLSATVSGYNGALSYQWYINDKNRDYGGDAIRNATESTYYPDTSSVGTDYYYVVVTNTVGESYRSATSNVVEVTVTKSDSSSSKVTVYGPSSSSGSSGLSLYSSDSGSSTGITPVQFSDTGSHWASYYIENVAASGWIIGYPDGTFKPNGSITRAELLMIVYRLTGGATFTGASESGYSDVGSDDWYAVAVNYCVANGYLYGVFDGDSLLPNQAITRGEVAAILAKLKGYYSSSNGQSSFSDVNADDNFAGAIDYLAGLELINGYPDGTYRPNSSITRAEICTILFKGWIA